MPAWQLWGYPHAATAIGLLALALTGTVSLAAGAWSRKLIAAVAAAAGLAAWMHPWQGAIFLLVGGAVVLRHPSRPLVIALLVAGGAALAPLVYEALLPHLDAGW